MLIVRLFDTGMRLACCLTQPQVESKNNGCMSVSLNHVLVFDAIHPLCGSGEKTCLGRMTDGMSHYVRTRSRKADRNVSQHSSLPYRKPDGTGSKHGRRIMSQRDHDQFLPAACSTLSFANTNRKFLSASITEQSGYPLQRHRSMVPCESVVSVLIP